MMAPASSSFCTEGALVLGWKLRSDEVPPVVFMPLVLMLSLTTIGKPANAPSVLPAARSASTCLAAAKAPASSMLIMALSSDNDLARLIKLVT